jgi:tRNA threonylcarbamoyladenosine biosynthesis protein TsaB
VSVLAFDTATSATSVALGGRAGSRAAAGAFELRDDPPPGQRPGHAQRLLPLIDDVFAATGSSWDDVELLAVGVGPGTFTGLRIGIATARALAQARALPLVGVSTLKSLALGGAAAGLAEVVVPVIDARRSEVFAAAWRATGGGLDEQLLAPLAIAPRNLSERLSRVTATRLALGDGAVEFRAVLERSGVLIPESSAELHRVTAVNHCVLARDLHAGAPRDVKPEYLRLPDVDLPRRTE